MGKNQRTVPAKRKSAVRAKHEKLVPSYEAALDSRTGHWAQRIKPNAAALLAQTLMPCIFVIKNHGANNIMLTAGYAGLMDVPPDAVRATFARDTITVENRGDKSVLIEFEFLPVVKK